MDAQCKIGALEQVVVDQKLVSEKELALRAEDVRREMELDLKTEARRRAFEKLLKDHPIQ